MSKASARLSSTLGTRRLLPPSIDLICHANSATALRAAVDNGADCIRLTFQVRSPTYSLGAHAFQRILLTKGIRYALLRGCRVCLDLDDHDWMRDYGQHLSAILSRAFDCGINEVSLASPALLLYLRVHHPAVRIHFATGENVLNRYALMLAKARLGVTRVVLPRVFSVAQLRGLATTTGLELEMYGYGARCAVIAPKSKRPSFPGLDENRRMNEEVLIESCAGGDGACNDSSYVDWPYEMERAFSLLPELRQAGVRGLIVEVPDGAPAQIAGITRAWRDAIDAGASSSTGLSVRRPITLHAS